MKIIDRKFLPVTTRSAHAATIAFFKDHPVFAWFGGSREGAFDVAIYLNNLKGDGETISIGDDDQMPRWNPILFPLKNKLFLFEKAGVFCDRWQTFIHDITDWDNGITKKEIKGTMSVLPSGLNGPVKTKPLHIEEKDLILCGSSVETFYDWTSYIEEYEVKGRHFSFKERSKPLHIKEKHDFTHTNGVTTKTLGVIQPSLWMEKDRSIKAFFRSSHGLGKIYISTATISEDGKSYQWTTPKPTNFDNPNSGIDTIYFNDNLYLVYNPYKNTRQPLVISKIKQNGCTQFEEEDSLIIRNEVTEDFPFITQELSYPYIVEHKGLLHLVYTYGRKTIEYVVIEP